MGGRRKYTEERVPVQARIPRSLHSRLLKVCEDRIVGQQVIFERALTEYLDRLEPVDVILATPDASATGPWQWDQPPAAP